MKKSNRSTIYNALPIVATAYGEQFGVKVKIGSDTAYTDGQTIVVPNVPDDYANMDVVWGYLAHEAAHVKLTDFKVQPTSDLHHHLTNIFEDCRIERWMINEYPGTAFTLDAVANYMDSIGQYAIPTPNQKPSEVFGAYCLYWLQGNGVGQRVLQSKAKEARKVLATMLSPATLMRLEIMLRKGIQLTSTQEVSDHAAALISMLEEEAENESNGGGQGQSEDSSSPTNTATSDAAEVLPNIEDEETIQDSSLSSTVTNQEALRQILQATSDNFPVTAQETLKRELSQLAKEEGDPNYQSIRTAEVIPSSGNGGVLLSKVRSTSNRIRHHLAGFVEAQNRSTSRTARSGKRFDSQRLSRLVTGSTNVFIKTSKRQHPNTAVHLLVDSSGSMSLECSNGKSRIEVARESALALALSLEAIHGVNPAVTYFGGTGEKLLFSAVKHGQRVTHNAGRFMKGTSGETPMAEALWYAAYEMSKLREDRKLIIIVTDGEPQSAQSVLSIASLCARSNVEIVAIGIGNSAVSKIFTQSLVINDVTELRETLFKLVATSLTIAA